MSEGTYSTLACITHPAIFLHYKSKKKKGSFGTNFLKKGNSLSGEKKQIKRWIVPVGKKEKLLIATTSHPGRNSKLIVKILSKLNEHFTLSVKDDGAFDFHHTEEGKEKNYIPLAKGRINLDKLREAVEKFQQEIFKALKNPVEIADQSLQEFIFMIPKSQELLKEFYAKYYPITGRKQIYPDSETQKRMVKELQRYFHMGYVDEIIKEKFPFAFLLNPEDESIKFLFNDHGKCWIVDFTTLVSILPNSFEIESRYCYRCGTEVPLTSGWCPICKKRIKKLRVKTIKSGYLEG